MRRIDELTGLRAVAIGMVLLSHASGSMPAALRACIPGDTGDVGVQIFFVLSGYLITRILMGEFAKTGTIDFWGFYRRRAYRIAPAFYAFLLTVSGLAAFHQIRVSWQQVVLSGTYLWNYAHLLRLDGSYSNDPQGVWYLGHTWSLALEEQFYWAWPAAFLAISRKQLPFLLPAAILLVPVIRMASYVLDRHDRAQLHLMFHTGIDIILVGCLLALHQESLERRLGALLVNPVALTLSAFTVIVALNLAQTYIGGGYIVTYGVTFSAGVMAFMMLSIMKQPRHWLSRLLRTAPLVYVGTLSYSLYLWQQIFTNATMPTALAFPLNIAAPIGIAMFSYHFVELPFLRLKDRVQPPLIISPEGQGYADTSASAQQPTETEKSAIWL